MQRAGLSLARGPELIDIGRDAGGVELNGAAAVPLEGPHGVAEELGVGEQARMDGRAHGGMIAGGTHILGRGPVEPEIPLKAPSASRCEFRSARSPSSPLASLLVSDMARHAPSSRLASDDDSVAS